MSCRLLWPMFAFVVRKIIKDLEFTPKEWRVSGFFNAVTLMHVSLLNPLKISLVTQVLVFCDTLIYFILKRLLGWCSTYFFFIILTFYNRQFFEAFDWDLLCRISKQATVFIAVFKLIQLPHVLSKKSFHLKSWRSVILVHWKPYTVFFGQY